MIKHFHFMRLWVLILVSLCTLSFAEIKIPELTDGVMDEIGLLAPSQQNILNNKIIKLESETGSQIAVLIINSTEGEAILDYSVRVMEKWQLGRKDVDDGVLLVVALKDRTMHLEVGDGLGGAIPDVHAKYLIDTYLVPSFRAENYSEGFNNIVDQLIVSINADDLPTLDEVSFIPIELQGAVLTPKVIIIVAFVFFIFAWLLVYLFAKKKSARNVIGSISDIEQYSAPTNSHSNVAHNRESSWQKHIKERRAVHSVTLNENESLAMGSEIEREVVLYPESQHPTEDSQKDYIVVSSFVNEAMDANITTTNPTIVDLSKQGLKYRLTQLEKNHKNPENYKAKFGVGLAQAVVVAIFTGVFFATFFDNAQWGIYVGIAALIYNTLLHGTSISEHKWLRALLKAAPSSVITGAIVYSVFSEQYGIMIGLGLYIFQTIGIGLGKMEGGFNVRASRGGSSYSSGSSSGRSSSSSSRSSGRSGGGGRSSGGGASGSW